MPATKQVKVLVTCPFCEQQQPEPPKAFSTVCKKCGAHFHVQETLRPAPKIAQADPKRKRVACFECGTEIEAPASAESTMCKRCSRYIDLRDYRIGTAISKNFTTKGAFVIEPKGDVFNTESIVGEAIIRGRFSGKLNAEQSLTIYSSAIIKGSLKTGHLIIPAENHFRWKGQIKVGSAEIAGELAASLQASGTIILKSTARLFGDVEGKNFVVEEGAVMVGHVRSG